MALTFTRSTIVSSAEVTVCVFRGIADSIMTVTVLVADTSWRYSLTIINLETSLLTRFTEAALAVVADIGAVRAVHWGTQTVPASAGRIGPKTIVI